MKTLAIDCRMAHMSGIGTYLRNVVPLCMAAMPDVRFRLLGATDTLPTPEGCEANFISCNIPIYSIAEQWKIPALLRGCDAFWTPHYPIPIMTQVPLVVTVHDLAHLALDNLYTGLRRFYATLMFGAVRQKAREIIFVSEFSRQEFLNHVGLPKGRMTVAHNGVDDFWHKLPLMAPKAPPYFLAVGNIKPHKNVGLLCRAFARIASHCDAQLVFVGKRDGFKTEENRIDDLSKLCEGRIHFAGHLPMMELAGLLSECAALIFPSLYEGFGLPPLESLAAGVPVIASRIPPVRETCGNLPSYFDPASEEELVRCLMGALDRTTDERKTLALNSRTWASRFSWQKTAKAIVPILHRTLNT